MARNLTPFDGRGSCCVYDTCGEVCPTGARYSPDFTFRQLTRSARQIVLHDRTLVRRLVLDDRALDDRGRAGRAPGSARTSTDRVSRPALRRGVGLLLELAPAAALGELALPERAGQQLRPGRPLHDRARVHRSDARPSTTRPIPGRT